MVIAYGLFAQIDLTNLSLITSANILLGTGYGIIAGPITVLAASNFTGNLLSASPSVAGVFRQVGITLAVAIFVSGLYANLQQAQTESINYAQKQIVALHLEKRQQQRMLTQTISNIKNQNTKSTTIKNHVSKKEKMRLI
ncbi:hypothetical protein EQ500_11495 [Lactobacillus sp. XV13L]|nr:hypothetical protein [Lactobacillus sp. XV13L]